MSVCVSGGCLSGCDLPTISVYINILWLLFYGDGDTKIHNLGWDLWGCFSLLITLFEMVHIVFVCLFVQLSG